MQLEELKQKLDQIEEQANLTIAEFPRSLTKERQRMIIALVRYIRAAQADMAEDDTTVARLDFQAGRQRAA